MSTTGGIILLSSSPPRIFARSPLPAENRSSSPALPSPADIFASQRSHGSQDTGSTKQLGANWLGGHRRFKTTNLTRDGFAGGFSNSRTLLLKELPNKRNVPLPKRDTSSRVDEKVEVEKSKDQAPISPARSQDVRQSKRIEDPAPKQHAQTVSRRNIDTQSPVKRGCGPSELSPLRLAKAPSRRLDWTPPATRASEASPEPATVSFSESLLGDFGYNKSSSRPWITGNAQPMDEGTAIKRRKVEVINTGARVSAATMDAPKLPAKTSKSNSDLARIRNKSLKKKYTTITGIATSNYFGEEKGGAAPMMQYPTATQQRAQDNDSDAIPETVKRKPVVKKSRTAKKAPPKSTLLSPQSAMKAMESQDMLFGSASQLARDESPTFIRDTVQAIKHSEETSFSSDPISTQITIPTSEPAKTPNRNDRRGVSRFVKSRNLWSVAGRDDDNALLQVDTVDMFDTPGIRAAFAGKDVLLEPAAPRFKESVSPKKQAAGQQGQVREFSDSELRRSPTLGADGSRRMPHLGSLINFDELGLNASVPAVKPQKPSQIRSLHTAATAKAPIDLDPVSIKDVRTATTQRPPMPEPIRPAFTGFTTSQLASQLAAYGFKPIKKREKMIEVLDRCWDDKHRGISHSQTGVCASADETSEMSHSDFLTKVHDISARPTPKMKKPRGRPKRDEASSPEKSTVKESRTKKAEGETMIVDNTTLSEKTTKTTRAALPKVRKSKEVVSKSPGSSKSKTVPKVKTKLKITPLSEEYVMDIDDVRDDDQAFGGDVDESQNDNTGVKPAQRQACSLPPIPPSSDAFDTASWLDKKSSSSTSKSETPKTAKPTKPKPKVKPKAVPSKRETPKSANTSPSRPSSPLPTITPTSTPSSSYPSSSSQPPLSTQITLAITTFVPPTPSLTNPTNPYNSHHHNHEPTFHQKILMYDPIILEDLAAWLNTEGFRAIGEDREVGALEVRDWCEGKGVCCLWRGGWRGGNGGNGGHTGRVGEGEV